jgi:predicted DCC family thiol-disulfide oxidoreductase YuxK
MSGNKEKNVQFIYDGECPICNHFACAIKIRNNNVELINGREKSDLLEIAKSEYLNIDDGAIVNINGHLLYGSDAIVYLANNLKFLGLTGFLFKQVFQFKLLAILFYPLLVFIRKFMLKLMGKSLVNHQLKSKRIDQRKETI